MREAIRILGLDPGLSAMGWGVIAVSGRSVGVGVYSVAAWNVYAAGVWPGLLRARDLVALLPMQDSVVKLRMSGRSLRAALEATVVVAVLGVGLGYVLAKGRFPGRGAIETVFSLPMALPPTVVGYYLLTRMGGPGPIRS